jgi:GT2 family glycosyltransferase
MVLFIENTIDIAIDMNQLISEVSGEFIGFINQGDTLSEHALSECVDYVSEHIEAELLYTDEDRLNDTGERQKPFFKPDWSPDLFLCFNYIKQLALMKTSMVRSIGGFKKDLNGSHLYDLLMRLTETTQKISHIPSVCYHRRIADVQNSINHSKVTSFWKDGEVVLSSYLARNDISGTIEKVEDDSYRIRYNISGGPRVSIIIPFKDLEKSLLPKCVDSILSKTTYSNYELILISNNSEREETYAYLDDLSSKHDLVRVEYYNKPYNFAKINNYAERLCNGKYLLFLNSDTEVLDQDWLHGMLEFATQKNIGAVGAKLLFPDYSIQHAGVIIGLTGFSGHVFSGVHEMDRSWRPFGQHYWPRNYLAITAACLMVERQLFQGVGGFDERFVINGNDVDLCLRIHAMGYRNVVTPFVKLIHRQSVIISSYTIPEQDFENSLKSYSKYLYNGDPFYNVNLSLEKTVPMFSLSKKPNYEANIKWLKNWGYELISNPHKGEDQA